MCFSDGVTTVAAVLLIKSLVTTSLFVRPINQMSSTRTRGYVTKPAGDWVRAASKTHLSGWDDLFSTFLLNKSQHQLHTDFQARMWTKHTSTLLCQWRGAGGLQSFPNCRTAWIHKWINTTRKWRRAWLLVKANEQNAVAVWKQEVYLAAEPPQAPRAQLENGQIALNSFFFSFLSLPPLEERDVSAEWLTFVLTHFN